MAVNNPQDFQALEPFFRVIEEGSKDWSMAVISSICWPRMSPSSSSSRFRAIPAG
jgi:hypothetical protein